MHFPIGAEIAACLLYGIYLDHFVHGQITIGLSRTQPGEVLEEGKLFSFVCTVSGGTCPGLITLNHVNNTGSETQVTSGCDPIDLSYGANVSCDTCTNIPSVCNITFTAERLKHQGLWQCRCSTYMSVQNNVTIVVGASDTFTAVGSEMVVPFHSNAVVYCEACFYPTALVNWTARTAFITPDQITNTNGVCPSNPELHHTKSFLTVEKSDVYTCIMYEPNGVWSYYIDIAVTIEAFPWWGIFLIVLAGCGLVALVSWLFLTKCQHCKKNKINSNPSSESSISKANTG